MGPKFFQNLTCGQVKQIYVLPPLQPVRVYADINGLILELIRLVNCLEPTRSHQRCMNYHTVHVDFCDSFPTGEYLLAVIDAYSQFAEVEIVKSTSTVSSIALQLMGYHT